MIRTQFMQSIMATTYPNIALEAISSRKFDGSWERLIARKLEENVKEGHSEAECILQSARGDYQKAAKMILDSDIKAKVPVQW